MLLVAGLDGWRKQRTELPRGTVGAGAPSRASSKMPHLSFEQRRPARSWIRPGRPGCSKAGL